MIIIIIITLVGIWGKSHQPNFLQYQSTRQQKSLNLITIKIKADVEVYTRCQLTAEECQKESQGRQIRKTRQAISAERIPVTLAP